MKKCIIFILAVTLLFTGCSTAQPAPTCIEAVPASTQVTTPAVQAETPPSKTTSSTIISAENVSEITISEETIPEETVPEETVPKQDPPKAESTTPPAATAPKNDEPAPTAPASQPENDTSAPAPSAPVQDTVTSGSDYPPATNNEVLMFVRNAKTIFLGEPETLDIFYYGNRQLSWYSSSPYFLQVDQNGQVTAYAEGCYQIYVSDGVYTAKAEIFAVYGWGMASGIYFDEKEITLTVGQSMMLELNGVAPGSWISYSSHDPSIVQVDKSLITAVSPGTTIIHAEEYYGNAANLRVTVIPNSDPIELNILPETLSLYVGESIPLEWCYTGTAALNWEVEGTAAYVDEDGLLTAREAGTCAIYLSDGTYADKCDVTVTIDPAIKPEEIFFRYLNTPMYDGVVKYKGDSAQFLVDVRPYTAEQHVHVSTSDPSVAKVELVYDCGSMVYEITYKKAGTCMLQLTSLDGTVVNSYTIHVKDTYDCDPGKSQLTPEEFAYLATQVGVEQGQEEHTILSGYLYVYLSDEEVTWERARDLGESYAHHWYEIGIDGILVTYAGWDEETGKHLFFAGY